MMLVDDDVDVDDDNEDDNDDDYRSKGEFNVRDKDAIIAPSSSSSNRYEPQYHTHYLVRW